MRSRHIHAENPSSPFLGTQNTTRTADAGLPAVHDLAPPSSPNAWPVVSSLLSVPLSFALCSLASPLPGSVHVPLPQPGTLPLHEHRPALSPPPGSAQRTPTSSGGPSRPRGPLGLPLLLSVPSLLASSLTRIQTVIVLLDHCALTAWPPHEHGGSVRAGLVSTCPVGCLSPAPGTVPGTEQDESTEERCQSWSKKKLTFLRQKRWMRRIVY